MYIYNVPYQYAHRCIHVLKYIIVCMNKSTHNGTNDTSLVYLNINYVKSHLQQMRTLRFNIIEI